MDRNQSEAAETDETVSRHDPHDSWPIDGYDGPDRKPAYLGIMNPGTEEKEKAVLYDDHERTVFEADIDEDERRLVPRAETERELGATETVGDLLEDLGETLDRDSLSEFARERLQDDADDPADESPAPDAISFTRSNTATDASHELEFSGSYRYATADGRELSVQRTFEVSFDDSDDPQVATVDVIERVLRTDDVADTDPAEDAEQLDERETAFELDLADRTADRQTDAYVEDQCEQWHTARVDPPREMIEGNG